MASDENQMAPQVPAVVEDVGAPAQLARVTMQLGRNTHIDASVKVTSGGLLAIGAMVSGILLSTAALVHVAIRRSKEAPAA